MSTPFPHLPAVTLAQVEKFKRQAHDLKKELGIKHAAALDAIAQRESFPNWMRLLQQAGGSDALRDRKQQRQAEAKTAKEAS